MLHWNNFAGNTNYLGSDEDGPHAADNYGWYYDGAAWAHLSDYGYAPNVFTIRAKALIDDNKSTVIYNASSPIVSGKAGTMQAIKADKSANTGNNAQSSAVLRDGSKSLMGYQVERRNYTSYPIGPNVNGQGIWDSIAGTTTTDYLDLNVNYLFHNCYEYRVIAKYDEGVSIPSNIDFDCIGAVSNYDDAIHITIYPNPSTTYVRISFDNVINTMEVFNSLGVLVAYQNVENQSFLTLHTSNYTAGTYNARFITKNGEVLNRRFVVTK
jgi:hypothetical protein